MVLFPVIVAEHSSFRVKEGGGGANDVEEEEKEEDDVVVEEEDDVVEVVEMVDVEEEDWRGGCVEDLVEAT